MATASPLGLPLTRDEATSILLSKIFPLLGESHEGKGLIYSLSKRTRGISHLQPPCRVSTNYTTNPPTVTALTSTVSPALYGRLC